MKITEIVNHENLLNISNDFLMGLKTGFSKFRHKKFLSTLRPKIEARPGWGGGGWGDKRFFKHAENFRGC